MSADLDQTLALYNQTLIKLSAIPDERRLVKPTLTAKAYSPICGSTVEIDLMVDANGVITDFGYFVEACALTKSVLAVMQDAIKGQNRAGVAVAAQEMQKMLDGAKPAFPPGWERLSVLEPIKDHTARHNAVMLPFEAIQKAFTNKG